MNTVWPEPNGGRRGGVWELGVYRKEGLIDSAFDNQPVLHLEDRLCPRLQKNQSKSEKLDQIGSVLDIQPFLHLEDRLCPRLHIIQSKI